MVAKIERGSWDVDGVYQVEWQALRPTQFAVGVKEVELKQREFMEEYAPSQTDEKRVQRLVKANMSSVVIGPRRTLFCIDGHHKLRMLVGLMQGGSIPEQDVYVKIIDDFSSYKDDDFFAVMLAKNYVFLFDEHGVAKLMKELPRLITDLQDDPYRSLAWIVRKVGGFKDMEIPMQEFSYAQLFRTYVKSPLKTNQDYIVGIHEALEVLRTRPEAQRLKGAIPPHKIADCKSLFSVPVLAGLLGLPS